jgi:hypothetical protein
MKEEFDIESIPVSTSIPPPSTAVFPSNLTPDTVEIVVAPAEEDILKAPPSQLDTVESVRVTLSQPAHHKALLPALTS